MRVLFIHPRWPKIKEQTAFNLPPLGMVQAAGCLPEDVEIRAVNENVEEVDPDCDYDLIAISTLLTCQAPRAYELAGQFRARGKTVIMGGLHVSLCPDEAARHVDSLCIGEGEGLIEQMIDLGYIKQSTDSDDRRVRRLGLTANGKKLEHELSTGPSPAAENTLG